MDTTSPTIGFAGDLTDPWVVGIARALSGFSVVPCEQHGAELPGGAFEAGSGADILVLHRSRLSAADVSRLEELRRRLGAENWPRIVLCVSPYVRYAELERCADLVEIVTPEATAAETLPRQLERMMHSASPAARPNREPIPVEVVSSDYELRCMFREACTRAGYRATDSAALSTAPEPGDVRRLTVWDVPVLEPRWEERLERRGRMGPVLALLGFAERDAVTRARDAGASACLDLPCAIEDLIDALDRMAREEARRPRSEAGHSAPPSPFVRPSRRRLRAAAGVRATERPDRG